MLRTEFYKNCERQAIKLIFGSLKNLIEAQMKKYRDKIIELSQQKGKIILFI